jgi:hypothetical protein
MAKFVKQEPGSEQSEGSNQNNNSVGNENNTTVQNQDDDNPNETEKPKANSETLDIINDTEELQSKENKTETKQPLAVKSVKNAGKYNPGKDFDLYHVNLNTRIHDDLNEEYLDNWNIRKYSKADFMDFCRNGGTLLPLFKAPTWTAKDKLGNVYPIAFEPKTIEQCMEIFQVPKNTRYIQLLWCPEMNEE